MLLTERFEGFTVASALATRSTTDPGGEYLRFRDDVFTFGQVDSEAEALAAALSNLGLEAGDRLALVLSPCPEFVISMFARAAGAYLTASRRRRYANHSCARRRGPSPFPNHNATRHSCGDRTSTC